MLPRLLTCALFITCMLFAGASSAYADPLYLTTITFDDRPTGQAFSTQPRFSSIRGTSRFGGPLSETGQFRVAPLTQATTAPNAAFGIGPLFGDPSFNSLMISFNTNCPDCAPSSCPFCTDLVSLDVVGTQLGQTADWEVRILDRDGKILYSTTGTTDRHVVFSSTMRNISRLLFFASTNNEGIDTLSYNAPIPEPATLVLFGTGLAALGAARRRRKASASQ